MDLSTLFTDPTVMATVAMALAYVIANAVRRWWQIPPAPVALVIAVAVYVVGRYAGPSDQAVVVDVLKIVFAVLAAAGVNVVANRQAWTNPPRSDLASLAQGSAHWWEPWQW